MLVPISWLKDFVEIDIPLEDLAHLLTMAGLEVEEIHYAGLPRRAGGKSESGDVLRETKITGIEWAPDKLVVAEILEVMPHPNADRLVLCRLNDGAESEHIVLTGAPNLFEYKGKGALEKSIKVAYAREGARIYDGHKPGLVLTTLKRTKIRGVVSDSMVCSEKELGISDEHEGIIVLDDDAPVGMPLVHYMGDAVFDIAITPNIARDANILGVAREIAAITGKPLKKPDYDVAMKGAPLAGRVSVEIREPALNPRFMLGLIENIEIKPSPYWVQRRLRMAGTRPINNIVDATNYAMLEIGEPLHAFDYDILLKRSGGKPPKIITRTAEPGEKLVTLDGIEHELDDFTVLVCDTRGPLSIAGVMGGEESEVHENTRNVLLEAAAWNYINIRRTIASQRMSSEAAYRFSRGVHPAMSERGLRRCLLLMHNWADGSVADGFVDAYPLQQKDPTVTITPADVERWLGIQLTPQEIAKLLSKLEFGIKMKDGNIFVKTPDHRLDIGEGVIGKADLMEEIARIYGYENIPETRLADELPPQKGNSLMEREERIRDLLVDLGLQEVVNYRLTSPEREARMLPDGKVPAGKKYIRMANPIASDRNVLRQSLLSSVLENIERNTRIRERIALFEIGPIFLPARGDNLPDEQTKLAIVLTGLRAYPFWEGADTSPMDFYDLKGIINTLLEGVHIENAVFEPCDTAVFHPGKCARVLINGETLGEFGELHPLVREHYDFPEMPVIGGELDLRILIEHMHERHKVQPVPAYPPVLEDLAVVVDEAVPAGLVLAVIRKAGGKKLAAVQLFDIYQGEQIDSDKKSLAYNLVYQAPDHTLSEKEAKKIRQKIIYQLEKELGAQLRS